MRATNRFGSVVVFLGLLLASRGLTAQIVEGSPPPPVSPPHADSGNGFVEPKPGQRFDVGGGWYLGVYGYYSPNGLVLTRVYPGTAAAWAGLETGDKIVSVNGIQVRAWYPLDVALQSTRSGWVRLLVQDRRTNRLANLDVRLTRVGRVYY